MGMYKFQAMLDAVEASTTGGCAGVAGFRRVGVQFKAANITSGNGEFKLQGTVNGTDWTFLNFIDHLTTTATGTLTRLASKTLSANGTALVWLDEGLSLRAIRASITVTTDGSYGVSALISE